MSEIDPGGKLTAEWNKFIEWSRRNPSETVKPEPPGLCPVSMAFDENSRGIAFCSVPGFARFLDADENTLTDRLMQKRWALRVWIYMHGAPQWPYTRKFRKGGKQI